LFGPTESGKTFTLKGKTGMDRGILPRAVEDMFNIVRNSEDKDDKFDDISFSRNDRQTMLFEEGDYLPSHHPGNNPSVPERMFLKVAVY
jgi:hypothetical protein